jgi:type I restriction enzyme R subunit
MMILRPYQYFATGHSSSKILTTTLTFGTQGSGKTLTSFKASHFDGIARRVQSRFVVDRKDLDYQTMTEFNAFKKTVLMSRIIHNP